MARSRNRPREKLPSRAKEARNLEERPLRLDGYIRVSYVGHRGGASFLSPRLQEAKIRAYADAHGYQLGRILSELNRSGSSTQRPQLQTALDRIERGESDGIIVTRLDRFGRTVTDALRTLEAIEAAGAKLVSLDSSGGFGRALSTILFAFAELELTRLADSTRAAHGRAVRRGIHPSSYTPAGYLRHTTGELRPDPRDGPLVAQAFRLRADGATYAEVARFLEQARVTSCRGSHHWTGKGVYELFQNPVYLGEAYSGETRNVSAHPALVRRAVWLAAHAASARARANAHGKTLLAGLARCGGCCHALSHNAGGQSGNRVYRCLRRFSAGDCTTPAYAAAAELERAVVEGLLAQLESHRPGHDLGDALRVAEQKLALVERSVCTHRGWRSAYSDTGGAGVAEARAAVLSLWRQLQLAKLPSAPTLRQRWPEFSLQERRHVLSTALDAVIVFRGSDPIEERIQLVFAGAPRDWYPKMGSRRPLRAFHRALSGGQGRPSRSSSAVPQFTLPPAQPPPTRFVERPR
jgi:DNA invertase Pin-like site-specific DNA recombinase